MIPKTLFIFVTVGIISGFAFGSFLLDFKTSSQLEYVEGPGLSVVTEKSDFKKGEDIQIRIINSGTIPLKFLDTSYGLRITGLSGTLMFNPAGYETNIEMKPNQEVEFIWDQIKNDGDLVLEGLYKISARGMDLDGNKIEKSITINIWK